MKTKIIAMKKLFILILISGLTISLFASGGGTSGVKMPVVSSMGSAPPPDFCPTGWLSGSITTQLYGPLVLASCPNELACTNGAFGASAFEALTFKNPLFQDVCYLIDYQTAFGNSVSFSVVGFYAANQNCATTTPRGFADNGTYFVNQPAVDNYQLQVPPCTEFTVITWGYLGARGAYSVRVSSTRNVPSDVACAGSECRKLLTIGGTPVPTMTQWGLFLFGLIIVTFASVALYNFTRSASVKQ